MSCQKEKILEFNLEKGENIFGICIKGGDDKPIGIYISDIEKFSVADLAGLKVYDLILSVNQYDFTKLKIQEAIHILSSIKSARIVVKRSSENLISKPFHRKKLNNFNYEFIRIQRSDPSIRFGFTINFVIEEKKRNKFIVTSILNDSLAGLTNLKIGDEILVVNNKKVRTLDDFYKTLQVFKTVLDLKMIIRRISFLSESLTSGMKYKNDRKSNSINDLDATHKEISKKETGLDAISVQNISKKRIPKLNKAINNISTLRSKSEQNEKDEKFPNYSPIYSKSNQKNKEHIYDNNFSLKEKKQSKSNDELACKNSSDWSIPFLESYYLMDMDDMVSQGENLRLKKVSSDYNFTRYELSKSKEAVKIDKKEKFLRDNTKKNCKFNENIEGSHRELSSNMKIENQSISELNKSETYCILPIEIELRSEFESSFNIESETIIAEKVLDKNLDIYNYSYDETIENTSRTYDSYKTKVLPHSIEYTPDGLIQINLTKQHDKSGLKFKLDETTGFFRISGLENNFKAQNSDLIQVKHFFLNN
ncbi:unnamed protein product [Brachionus calyciflorus]|uniref:PDZ domain-containing protein n=1 Tax=Brachionus calyciflorus TaxID=104777 RepID=A0A813WKN2_9BILA|nr:unnamed protein product [Brachionus calyciflorus]